MPANINRAALHSLSQAVFRSRKGAKRSEQLQEVKERGRKIYQAFSPNSPSRLPPFSSFRAIRDFTIHRRDGNENLKKNQ